MFHIAMFFFINTQFSYKMKPERNEHDWGLVAPSSGQDDELHELGATHDI